jgi:hypothetical protein
LTFIGWDRHGQLVRYRLNIAEKLLLWPASTTTVQRPPFAVIASKCDQQLWLCICVAISDDQIGGCWISLDGPVRAYVVVGELATIGSATRKEGLTTQSARAAVGKGEQQQDIAGWLPEYRGERGRAGETFRREDHPIKRPTEPPVS